MVDGVVWKFNNKWNGTTFWWEHSFGKSHQNEIIKSCFVHHPYHCLRCELKISFLFHQKTPICILVAPTQHSAKYE